MGLRGVLFGRRRPAQPKPETGHDDPLAPDPNRLNEMGDLIGLMRALYWPGGSEEALGIRRRAAEYLARYPHLAVLDALLDVALGEDGARYSAESSAQRLLYPWHQDARLGDWWTSGPDAAAEASQILDRHRKDERDKEWAEAKRAVDKRIGTPLHMEAVMSALIHDNDSVGDGERAELAAWKRRREAQATPLLEQERARFEAAWAARDASWAAEERALAQWAQERGR